MLPLTSSHLEQVAAIAQPLRARLAAIDGALLPGSDRRLRRRLDRLKRALEIELAGSAPPVEAAMPPAPSLAHPPRARPSDDQLITLTRGRRVLFVGNCAGDEKLRERLAARFDFGTVDMIENTPRSLRAGTRTIETGTYDLVLGATGFLGHRDDAQISRACASGGVPYVRVNRGRPQAVEIALEHNLLGRAAAKAG